MRNKLKYAYLFLGLIWVTSCAQIVNPTGGSKDTTSPEVVSVEPINKTTKFKATKIEIKFNEFIQLNTPNDQVIISPPLENKPEFINKGKVLEIKLKDDLLSNTTYTINFGNAIGDNTENNLLKNYSYVFSTGANIDSNFVAGNVLNAFNNKPEPEATVALYNIDGFNDSTIIKNKPIYITKTNTDGSFTINNLPNNSFKIFAFNDANKNLKIETTEAKAFLNTNINTTDTINRLLTLQVFKPNLHPLQKIVDTFNREPNKFVFIVYQPNLFNVKNNNGNKTYVNHIPNIAGFDTFYVFTSTQNTDTFTVFNITNNSGNNVVRVKHKFIYKANKPVLTITKQLELNDTIKFSLNNPIIKIDTAQITLQKDTIQISYNLLKISDFEYAIVNNWEPKTTYRLAIKDSALYDFYNQYNKQEKAVYATKELKDYANLILNVKVPKDKTHQYILQVLSNDEKTVVYQYIVNQSKQITIDYMLPGTYKIKYIYDTNNNGIWDNGDLNTLIQPEKIGYNTEIINIKAYWDLEQSVLIE
ncbi:MAG: Ig-like domain-containing protein [Bacteroidia bacterium]|nr:Ig-like domain-containing protein [Bacteroidia bacterium]